MAGWALFGLGAAISVSNFYLSSLREPLHRAAGRSRDSYKWVSGVPLAGSALIAVSWTFWLKERQSLPLDVVTALLVLIDTGGIHWFAIVMTADWLRRRGRARGTIGTTR